MRAHSRTGPAALARMPCILAGARAGLFGGLWLSPKRHSVFRSCRCLLPSMPRLCPASQRQHEPPAGPCYDAARMQAHASTPGRQPGEVTRGWAGARTSGAKGSAAGSQGGRVWRSMALLPTSGRATASDGCHSRLSRSGAPSPSRPLPSPANAPGSGLPKPALTRVVHPLETGVARHTANLTSSQSQASMQALARHTANLHSCLARHTASLHSCLGYKPQTGSAARRHCTHARPVGPQPHPTIRASGKDPPPEANHGRDARAPGHAASEALLARASGAAPPSRLLAPSGGRPSAAAASGAALSPGAPAAARASSRASASSAAGAGGPSARSLAR